MLVYATPFVARGNEQLPKALARNVIAWSDDVGILGSDFDWTVSVAIVCHQV